MSGVTQIEFSDVGLELAPGAVAMLCSGTAEIDCDGSIVSLSYEAYCVGPDRYKSVTVPVRSREHALSLLSTIDRVTQDIAAQIKRDYADAIAEALDDWRQNIRPEYDHFLAAAE